MCSRLLRKVFLRIVAVTLATTAALEICTAAECERPAAHDEVVSSKSVPLDAKRFSDISSKLEVVEILKRLGPAARDVGSGLFLLQWDVADGRVFTVSATDLCAKARHVGFGSRVDDSKAAMAAVLGHFAKRTDTSSLAEDGIIVIRPKRATWPEGTFSGLALIDDQPPCQADQDLYDRFVQRNRTGGLAAELFDSGERWRLATSSELNRMPMLVDTSDDKRLKTVMTLFAPAFSTDGRQAFVFLAFSWSMHGASAGYVLDKGAEGWKVRCSLLNFAL